MTGPLAPPFLNSPGADGPRAEPIPRRECPVCGAVFRAVTLTLPSGRPAYLRGCAACRLNDPRSTIR